MHERGPCIDIIGVAECTGCFACAAACSLRAITMELDSEGFYRPVVNREVCSECGLCQDRCPVLIDMRRGLSVGDEEQPRAFAAWTRDEASRLAGSSGGIFFELAQVILQRGGAVAGCVFDEQWTPKHIVSTRLEDVKAMRGSKYALSSLEGVYDEVIAHLERGAPVLFSGTPCQVAAMRAALDDEQRRRVLLVDIVCHGVPSLTVFQRYLSELFDGEPVAEYSFRDKTFGWQSVLAVSKGGRRYNKTASADAFFRGFVVHHFYNMPACHHCRFSHVPRVGDLTLGDFWGCPEKWHDLRGVSVVLANSEAGARLLETLASADKIALEPTSFTTAVAKNKRIVSGSLPAPTKRATCMKLVAAGKSFAEIERKMFPGKLRQLWAAFVNSEDKLGFLEQVCRAVGRRLGVRI